MFGRRILILAAHPDDEVVACAAAIGRARAQGAQVFVLYLTDGCVAREALWPWHRRKRDAFAAHRRAEAEKAARFLGIAPLSWPKRPARHLWRELPEVCAEARAAVVAHGIDQVWVPAFEGGNADHDGLNAVGSALARDVNVLEFAEYNFAGGRTRSQEFPFPNGTERTIELTPEERAAKKEALVLYASEKGNLDYVLVEQESFRPMAVYDYARPAHPGTLWYARFQWVPFRHPRVDFTRPEEVSEKIAAFLALIG